MKILPKLKTTAGWFLHPVITMLDSDNPIMRTAIIGTSSAILSGVGTYFLDYGWPTIATVTATCFILPGLSSVTAHPLNRPTNNRFIRNTQRTIKAWWRTALLTLPPILVPGTLLNTAARTNLAITIPALCITDLALAAGYKTVSELLQAVLPGYKYTGRITATSALTAGAIATFITDSTETILLSCSSSALITFLLVVIGHGIKNEACSKTLRGTEKTGALLPSHHQTDTPSYTLVKKALATMLQTTESASELSAFLAAAKLLMHIYNLDELTIIAAAQLWLTNTLALHKIPNNKRAATRTNTTQEKNDYGSTKEIVKPAPTKRKTTIIGSFVSYAPPRWTSRLSLSETAPATSTNDLITIAMLHDWETHIPLTTRNELNTHEQQMLLATNLGKLCNKHFKLRKNIQKYAALYNLGVLPDVFTKPIKSMRVTGIYCAINDQLKRTEQLLAEVIIVNHLAEEIILILPLTSYAQMSFAELPQEALLTSSHYHQLSRFITEALTLEKLEENNALSLPEQIVILHQRSQDAWSRAVRFEKNRQTNRVYDEIRAQHQHLERSPIFKQNPLGALLKTSTEYKSQATALTCAEACVEKIDALLEQFNPDIIYYSTLAELNHVPDTPVQSQEIICSFSYDPTTNTTMKNIILPDDSDNSDVLESYQYFD